jgi:hypothetical protein
MDPAGEQKDSLENLRAAYAVAYARYDTNTSQQWQVPAFTLAAQGALIAGELSAQSWISAAVGFVALLLGGVGALMTRRIEYNAKWDRELLDSYEAILLIDYPDLRLHHCLRLMRRLEMRPLVHSKARLSFEVEILRWVQPSFLILVLMSMTGLLSLTIGIARWRG